MKKKICVVIIFFLLAICTITIVLYINEINKYKSSDDKKEYSIDLDVEKIVLDTSLELNCNTTITDKTTIDELINRYLSVLNYMTETEYDSNELIGAECNVSLYDDTGNIVHIFLAKASLIVNEGGVYKCYKCDSAYLQIFKHYLYGVAIDVNKKIDIKDNLREMDSVINNEVVFLESNITTNWIYKDNFSDNMKICDIIIKGKLLYVDEKPQIIILTYDDTKISSIEQEESIYQELRKYMCDYLDVEESYLQVYMQSGVFIAVKGDDIITSQKIINDILKDGYQIG